MRRREFVAGGIALAAGKTTLAPLAWAQSAAPRIDRIIDVHCHVFNAADLPIEGFARRILVPKSVQTNELVARFADYPGADPEKNRRVHGAGRRIAGNCAACCGSSGSTGTFSASGRYH